MLKYGKLYTISNDTKIDYFWKTDYSRKHKYAFKKFLMYIGIEPGNDIRIYNFLDKEQIIKYFVIQQDFVKFENQFNLLK